MFEFIRNFEARVDNLQSINFNEVLYTNKDVRDFKLSLKEFSKMMKEVGELEHKADLPVILKDLIKRGLHELESVAARRDVDHYDKPAFDKLLDTLYSEFVVFKKQILKEEKALEVEKRQLRNDTQELEKVKSGAEDLVNSFKPLYTEHASYHSRLRSVFLGGAVFFASITIVFVWWVDLLSVIVNIIDLENGQSIIDKVNEAPPLLFVGILVWAIQLCIQEYRANSHYYLEYESKVTTLEMFDNLLAAQRIDKENYLPLFTLVLEKIIDNPSSAYIKNEPPKIMPISINKI